MLSSLLLLFGLLSLTLATPSADGAFLVFRQDLVDQAGQDLSFLIAGYANTYTQTPPISGNSNGASYTLSNFAYDIDMEGFEILSVSGNQFEVVWNKFAFTTVFDYNVHDVVGESGQILVYSLDMIAGDQLYVTLELDLTGPTVQLNALSVNLNASTDVGVLVDCTTTFCLVPVNDLANAVAQNFLPTFNSELVTLINQGAASYVNVFPTIIQFPSENVQLSLQGDYFLVNSNVVLQAAGSFTPLGSSSVPPFSPTVLPDPSNFASPQGQLQIIFTPFPFDSLLWSLNQTGFLNRVITPADVPPSFFIQLSTSSFFWEGVCPEFKNYPNMGINIYVQLYNDSTISINQNLDLASTFLLDFEIQNSTLTLPAFSLALSLTAQIALDYTINGDNWTITNTFVPGSAVGTSKLISSNLGTVSTTILDDAIALGFKESPPTIPTTNVPIPDGFQASSPYTTWGSDYVVMGMASFSYGGSIPTPQCSGSSQFCVEGNTCCSWNGGDGCCAYEQATCCSNGCCPGGWTCCGNDCCASGTTTTNTNTGTTSPTSSPSSTTSGTGLREASLIRSIRRP